MRARIRDTEIYFDIDGASLVPSGAKMRELPTAFLIHGGPGGDHSGCKSSLGALKNRMQLVYFDHRGHGRSARGNSQKYTIGENVEDMEGLRQYLGLDQIISIGTSYGGMVALAHAARYPASVSHLVLIGTAAHAGYAERAQQIVRERGTAEQISSCEDLFAGRLDTPDKLRRYYEVMGPLYSLLYDAGRGRESLERCILNPEALNLAHGPGGFLRTFDLRPELAAITAPTLILAGRLDWICAPEFSEEIHRFVRDSELRMFEESSHSIPTDESEKCIDAIAGFIVYRTKRRGL
jgi:proline iminopeptidase